MKIILARLGIWLVCVGCVSIALPWMFIAAFNGSPRYWTIAKGFDRTGNATAGGSDDEYLSARANEARRANRRWGCLLCKLLDVAQKGHCQQYNPPGITD